MKPSTRRLAFASLLLLGCAAGASAAPAATSAPSAAVADADRQLEDARKLTFERKAVALKKVLNLSPQQQAAFDPVLKAYDAELGALLDRRVVLAKEYLRAFDARSLDDATATRMVNDAIASRQAHLKLLQDYFAKASKAIGVAKAADFIQLENAFVATLDAKLALKLPAVSEAMKE